MSSQRNNERGCILAVNGLWDKNTVFVRSLSIVWPMFNVERRSLTKFYTFLEENFIQLYRRRLRRAVFSTLVPSDAEYKALRPRSPEPTSDGQTMTSVE